MNNVRPDQKINILLLTGSFRAGGTEKHYYQLLYHLNREKFNIYLGTVYEEDLNFGPLPEDIKTIKLPEDYLKAAKTLNEYILLNKITHIYSVAFETSVIVLIIKVLFLNRVRFIEGKRGFFDFPFKRKLFCWIINLISYRILANSGKAAHNISLLFKKKTRIIYNGIDDAFISNKSEKELLDELNLTENKKLLIGSVGRLHIDKGYDILLKSFADVYKKNKDIYLLLIGDGPEKTELEQLSKKLGINEVVCFAGNKKDGGDYIRIMDIFVLPSRTESLPNSLLEAMFIGKPSIASNVGGVAEIIKNNVNGLLYDTIDTDNLNQWLEDLILDETKRKKLGDQAALSVREDFDFAKKIIEFEHFLST